MQRFPGVRKIDSDYFEDEAVWRHGCRLWPATTASAFAATAQPGYHPRPLHTQAPPHRSGS